MTAKYTRICMNCCVYTTKRKMLKSEYRTYTALILYYTEWLCLCNNANENTLGACNPELPPYFRNCTAMELGSNKKLPAVSMHSRGPARSLVLRVNYRLRASYDVLTIISPGKAIWLIRGILAYKSVYKAM